MTPAATPDPPAPAPPASQRSFWLPTAILVALFLAAALVRLYPYEDDVLPVTSRGNDWLTYKLQALSILHDGLAMPIVPGAYWRPAGFLYNYFVAAVFALFGENAAYVYLVQAGLLGLSIGVMAAAFGDVLSPRARWGYLVALTAATTLDVFRYYTVRLLSENLLLGLLPLFFAAAVATLRSNRLGLALLSGALLGLAVLTRPNVVLMAPGTALLFLWYGRARRGARLRAAALLAAFGLVLMPMAARNYAVTGTPSLAVLTSIRKPTPGDQTRPAGIERRPQTLAGASVEYGRRYGRRILLCLGFMPLADPAYRLRPHWMLMWLGVGVFAWRAARRGYLEPPEGLLVTFVVLYLGPLVAIGGLGNYGIRMIMPVIPSVLLLAVRGLDMSAPGRAPASGRG